MQKLLYPVVLSFFLLFATVAPVWAVTPSHDDHRSGFFRSFLNQLRENHRSHESESSEDTSSTTSLASADLSTEEALSDDHGDDGHGDGGHGGGGHGDHEHEPLPESKNLYSIEDLEMPMLIVNATTTFSFRVTSATGDPVTNSEVTVKFHSLESAGHGAKPKPQSLWQAEEKGDGYYEVTVRPGKEGQAAFIATVPGLYGEDVVIIPVEVEASPPSKIFLTSFSVFIIGTLIVSTLMRRQEQKKGGA
ncbi:hypothetical protein [Heliorestis convoluta]|uniref:Uncharacterized protein n=1 Tax=Heliorestis convoluta TaxID=356322 RepID=A0A5Q2MYG4_9FIRM|nr:hypothetical protein [Heliorestis convoluta]QGG46186.1 hypothetical protein FTV88_0007 [Heliorestis convoluta]